jgi:hypothetical protein
MGCYSAVIALGEMLLKFGEHVGVKLLRYS